LLASPRDVTFCLSGAEGLAGCSASRAVLRRLSALLSTRHADGCFRLAFRQSALGSRLSASRPRPKVTILAESRSQKADSRWPSPRALRLPGAEVDGPDNDGPAGVSRWPVSFPPVRLCQVEPCESVPPRQLNPGVPHDLDTICLKCLHREPHRRYATAKDLAWDVKRFQAGEPVWARPTGRLERTCQPITGWPPLHPEPLTPGSHRLR
jgi:hypothetical protein